MILAHTNKHRFFSYRCRQLLLIMISYGVLNVAYTLKPLPIVVRALQSEMTNTNVRSSSNHHRCCHHRHHQYHHAKTTAPKFNSLSSISTRLRAGGEDNRNNDDDDDSKNEARGIRRRGTSQLSQLVPMAVQYANENFFLIGMIVAVIVAKIVPSLGKNGGILRAELFIGHYGVALIFLLSGLSLQSTELMNAISNIKLNGLVQLCIFGFWPFCIGLPLHYFVTRIIPGFPAALGDGLLIMTTLPTTVNMCIMLTAASGGNTASAICNAIISNLGGIVVTPLLLLKFFGTTIHLNLPQMVVKLCQKVLLPVSIGQLIRTNDTAKKFYGTHSQKFKRSQEIILLGIVWNAFCNTFTDGLGIQLKHSLALLLLLPTLHLSTMGLFFKFFSLPVFDFTKHETIAAMLCSSQKTLAFGLPLINTIFQGNSNLAFYVAPIMFIHPLQMVIGSFLLPTIQKFIASSDDISQN